MLSVDDTKKLYELAEQCTVEQCLVFSQLFQQLADLMVKEEQNSISLVLDSHIKERKK